MAERARIALPIFACQTGSDVYFRRLAEGLNTRGLDARILVLPWWREFFPALPSGFRRALEGYDLIHTNADWGSCFHVPGKTLLVTVHHCGLGRWYRPYTGLGQRLYNRGLLRRRLEQSTGLAHTIFCPSRSTCAATIDAFPHVAAKVRYLPHGIASATFRPSESDRRRERTLLSVGTICNRKGAALFPALMDALGPDFRLCYVGRGDGSLLRHPRIDWRPSVSEEELIDLYRTCAVFVSLSRLEGFGYAVAEAMSCAAPVVAAAGSSLPELIGDCEPQLFQRDDLQQCSRRIRAICSDEELACSLGRYNRKRVQEHFSMNRMIGAYLEAYREAIG